MSIHLNGDPITVTLFPDNTSQVWKLSDEQLAKKRAVIWWDYSHEGEFMQLAQLKHLLDFSGVENVQLQIRYLPYGRQDKWIANDATFALHSFAALLNTLHFERVFIVDPHSPVATQLINNSRAIYPHTMVALALEVTDSNMICYPDNGARTKYVEVYDTLLPYIYGEKVRDQATGYISSYKLVGNCRDAKVMIIDDICDGGRTFEILTQDLYQHGAEEVNLFVTHGLFTKGLKHLFNVGIERIFTAKGEAIGMSDGGFGFRSL